MIEQIADEVGIGSSALLTVLQDATIDLRDLRGEELTDRAKYAELVMKVSYTPASEIDLYEPDSVFHRVVPVESVEDRQGESRNATTPRSSITQRYQQLPGHDPSSRVATKIDRQCASRRHAASNSQDDSSASRLSSQRTSL